MAVKPTTYTVALDPDQGQTFLFSLFAHDPFHDMYFSHGTGKKRAVDFFNTRSGDVAGSPGLGMYKGGGGEDNESVTETDISLALKMGLTTIPRMADKIYTIIA